MPRESTDTKIAVMGTEMTAIKDNLGTHIEDQKGDFSRVHKKLDDLSKKMDSKYAGKWTEKFIVGVLVVLIASISMFVITGGA